MLPPRARAGGSAGQEAKAARSCPAGAKEPPSPFGDPRASSYPQPSLRQGHSWAGSGQSARLGTSVLARVALKARGGGWGAQNQPLNPEPMPAFSTAGGGSGGHLTCRVSLSAREKPENWYGASGAFFLALSLLLTEQMPQRASLLESNGVLLPRGSCAEASGGAGARDPCEASGRREAVWIPLAANSSSRSLGSEARPRRGRRAGGGLNTTQ